MTALLCSFSMSNEMNKLIWLAVVLLIAPIVTIGCGRTAEEESAKAQPVSVRATITAIRPAADGTSVASLTITTQGGNVFEVRIGDQIDPNIWGLPHFQGHKRLGGPIGVTYQQTSQGMVVVEFFE